jgi:uridine phosphorylase
MMKSDAAESGPDPCPEETSLINPVREAGEALVSARVILTFARPDYQLLCRLTQAASPPRYIWDCAVRPGRWQDRPLTVVAPALGAPYAAMVLEKLIALGARMVLALGWCGSLTPQVGIGSLVLPFAAVAGDGTSRHYAGGESEPKPDPALYEVLHRQLQAYEGAWQAGRILTTDAFYRETASLVRHYGGLGLLGLDLELAALFAVGRFRQVPVAGLAVVSDELSALTWRSGHRSSRFRRAREAASRIVLAAAAQWEADRG